MLSPDCAKKKVIEIVSLIVIAAMLCVIPTLSTGLKAGATSLSDLQDELNDLNKEQQQIEKELNKLKEDISNKTEIRTTLEEKIANAKDQIDLYNEQVVLLNSEIAAAQQTLDTATAAFDAQLGSFKERIRAMYMTGDNSYLGLLLSADDFADYLYKSELVKSVSAQDNALLNSLKDEYNKILSSKSSLESKQKSLISAQKALAGKQSDLEQEIKELDALIGELEEKQASLKEDSKDALAAKAELEKEILAASKNSGSIVYSGSDFVWPVPGYYKLSSGYKTASRPNHSGIDISSSGIYGKAIVAAADGQVTLAGNNGNGYGIYIMINHGKGSNGKTYATLYGHCSSIIVSKGVTVKAGQVIGYVGSTGNSTGPHLHFEIRINGSTVNPMNYFS